VITLITALANRSYCLNDYLEGLKNLDFDKKQIDLVWHDGSCDKNFKEVMDEWLKENGNQYNSIKYMIDKREPMHDITAGNPIKSARIASVYNRIRDGIKEYKNKYVFSLEDDIVAPPDTLKKLFKIMNDKKVGVAVGRQICRWSASGGKKYPLAWKFKIKKVFGDKDSCSEYTIDVKAKKMRSEGVEEIDGIPMGCNLIRSELYQKENFRATDNGLIGFDLIFGKDIKDWGFNNMIDWSIHCKHYHFISEGNIGKNQVIIYQ